MNVDEQTILYVGAGAGMVVAGLVSYLYLDLKDGIKANAKGVSANDQNLSEFKTAVARDYAPRSEIDRKFEMVREDIRAVAQDIKDSANDLKEFIEAKISAK